MTSCSRPALTHSGWNPMSAASRPNKRAISAGCTSTRRELAADRAQRPVIAVRGHRNDPRAHLEAELIAAQPERATYVRRAERGMSRERHFVGRRVDAHQRRGALRRQDEGGFRQVELTRERLHLRGIERAAVLDDAERIAGKRGIAGREDIE